MAAIKKGHAKKDQDADRAKASLMKVKEELDAAFSPENNDFLFNPIAAGQRAGTLRIDLVIWAQPYRSASLVYWRPMYQVPPKVPCERDLSPKSRHSRQAIAMVVFSAVEQECRAIWK